MPVMEYILVRGTWDTRDPFPMQGIEVEQVSRQYHLKRSPRLEERPDDYGWEIGNELIVQCEVLYQPGQLPERILVRAPEGGDIKITFDLAKELGEQLGANVFNRTTGQEVMHNFPGATAAEQQRAAEEEKSAALSQRKGCGGPSVFLAFFGL